MNVLLKEIEKHDVITFDVFDTLLKRLFINTDDIFFSVGEQLKDIDVNKFIVNRKNAEKMARRTFPEKEVNIHEIYMMLEDVYGRERCEEIKQIEIQTEINTAMPNMKIYPYYQKCVELKKKIYIISDMYLPGEIIRKILSHIGIDHYDKLYSSCEYRKTKWENGDLFSLCLKENDLSPAQVLHIGDNKRADIDMAKKNGMGTFHVTERGMEYSSQYRRDRFLYSKDNKRYYCRLKKFIDNSMLLDKGIAFRTGYEIFGPMLYYYTKWLQKRVHAQGIQTILFFSRDGYVLKKAYDLLQDDEVNTKYLYISRRSVIVPLLSYANSLEDFLYAYKSWPKEIKIRHFIQRMGLAPEDVEEELRVHNYKLEDKILYQEVLSNREFEKLFSDLRPKFIQIAKEQKVLFQQYFLDMTDGNEKVAIVDIGGRCTIEYGLNKLLEKNRIKIELFPCYFLMNDHKKQTKTRKTCYYDNPVLASILRFSYMFLEVFFSAPHGTVLAYQRNKDGDVLPILERFFYDKTPYSSDARTVLELQKGALSFVKKFQDAYEKYIPMNQELVFAGYGEFGLYPTKKDMNFWKKIHFDGDEFESLVSRKSILWYMIHPKYLKSDFDKSMWPAGFIRDLCKSKRMVEILFWIYYKSHK